MHMKGGLIVHPDYNTPAPSWAQIWQAAFAEFKRWIVDESGGELSDDGERYQWEQYGEDTEPRIVKRIERLALATGGDGAAFAIFHADMIPDQTGRVTFKINGRLRQNRHGGKVSRWPTGGGYYKVPTAPVIQLTPEQIAENERKAAERKERDRQQRKRNKADRDKVFFEDLTAYFFDTLPLSKAPEDAEGIKYLMAQRVPLDMLPHVRVAKTTRPAPEAFIFRRGIRPLSPRVKNGALVVPLFDVRRQYDVADPAGGIVAFQWIFTKYADDNGHLLPRPKHGGVKLFRENAEPKARFRLVHWIGDPCGAHVVALAEGLATAATFYQLTGIPTGSTCDCDELEKTGKALLDSFPNVRLIVAADDDFFKRKTNEGKDDGGAGEEHAENIQKYGGERVKRLPPPFRRNAMISEYVSGSDWNDYYKLMTQLYGTDEGGKIARDEARALVKKALNDWKERSK